jgi:hypothetical protein
MHTSRKPPLLVRPLTDEERHHREGGLRSTHAFTVRRGQILLASAQRHTPAQIAPHVGCSVQTVRHALPAFAQRGVPHRAGRRPAHGAAGAGGRSARVGPGPVAPASTHVRHTSPHVAIGIVGRGLLCSRLTPSALARADDPGCPPASGGQLEPCETLDDQPGPGLWANPNRRDRLRRLALGCSPLALGCQADVWWRRLAQPSRSAWPEAKPLRRVEKEAPQAATDRQALAGDGLLLPPMDTLRWRFVTGRPVSHGTGDARAWLAARMAEANKKAWRRLWEHASWPRRKIVRKWLTAPTQRVKRAGGCRWLVCQRPSQRPWRHPMAPRWVHGKRAMMAPTRLLTAQE